MNFDKVKTVLFPVLEGMGYTLDLDDGFDLQPAVVTFDRQDKTMHIDPKADSLNQVMGALSMYFEIFPAYCERVIYFQDGTQSGRLSDKMRFDYNIGYIELENRHIKRFIRFIHAIMVAANVGNAAQAVKQKVR